jgi:serine/threonine protein kinase
LNIQLLRHVDNCQDIATETINGEPHPCVAIKKLLPVGIKKEDEKEFIKAEYEMLNALREFTSPHSAHLIKAISFYKKTPGETEDLHFVFPWAEQGNLRTFWTENTASIKEDNHIIWAFDQLLGLADAIWALHDKNYRHGDLKPDNILCFKVPNSRVEDLTSCVLVISDVGLSRGHDELTHLRSRTKLASGETKTYAGPETTMFPDDPTLRRYDIWSLGCLYLEFIIWVLYGFDELERFREDLKQSGGKDGARFYSISDKNLQVKGSRQVADVNEVVKAWIKHIKTASRCAATGKMKTAFGNLIVLIEERMLVVNVIPTPPPARHQPIDGGQVIDSSENRTDVIPRLTLRQATNEDKIKGSQTAKWGQTGEPDRAWASEVYGGLEKIVQGGKTGVIEWIHNRAVSYKGPESMTYLTTSLRRASLDKSDDVSAMKFPPLTTEWF